jgi:hypothetical protein
MAVATRCDVERRWKTGTEHWDSAIATVVWRLEELYRIILVRRSDGAVALVEVPEELQRDFGSFNRNAVIRNATALQAAVQWALPDAKYSREMDMGKAGLCNGTTPAELGSLRRFSALVMGVDIGEYELLRRKRWN